jgi:hypothetical protein
MSVANSIQEGNFNSNLISLRKPLEFPDGTIQTTAYTGVVAGVALEQVLTEGNDAGGLGMTNVGTTTLANGKNVENITSLKFADITTQNTAYTTGIKPSLIYSNLVAQSLTLTQPNFTTTLATVSSLPIGYYQITVNYIFQNLSSATINFNFLAVIVSGNTTPILGQDYSRNFSIVAGDNESASINITVPNTVVQNVSVGLSTNITSGAFSGTTPSWLIQGVSIIKLTNSFSA